MTIGYIPSESLLMNLPVEEQDIGLDTGAIRNTIMDLNIVTGKQIGRAHV